MDFGLSTEISKDLLRKSTLVTSLSDQIEDFFRDKDYGTGIKKFTIGIVCVGPEFDFFFKERRKYSNTEKLIEYDIKVDYKEFKSANDQEAIRILLREIQSSFNNLKELKVTEFDFCTFKEDFKIFANER